VLGRASAEHWTGVLYTRRISPYLTRLLLPTGISANGVTWLMVLAGLGAAGAAAWTGLPGAVLAVLLVQLQMLLDCSDGEVARWRGTSTAAGVYLDRIGHYTAETGLALALGVRASGGLDSPDGWTTLGALLALLLALNKLENDLVHVARMQTGRPPVSDVEATRVPHAAGLRRLRSLARLLPFHRVYHSVELSALILLAALLDAASGDLGATRALLAVLLGAALVTVVGHLVAVLSSNRLR